MKQLEANLRSIEMDGLTWGGGKLVPVGFGIKKLQVNLVVEDEKVSIDDLQAKIEEDEDHVQSTDVVSPSTQSTSEDSLLTMRHPGCHAKVVDVLALSSSFSPNLTVSDMFHFRPATCYPTKRIVFAGCITICLS